MGASIYDRLNKYKYNNGKTEEGADAPSSTGSNVQEKKISQSVLDRLNKFKNTSQVSRPSLNSEQYDDSWKRPNDVSDFDYSGTDLALDNTTDYNRLAELKIAADREAESNKYAVSALGGGGKSTAAKTAYETYLAEHTIPPAQKKVYTNEDSLAYMMLKDRAEAEKRQKQQNPTFTQRIPGLEPSSMGNVSGYANAIRGVTGTPAQDAFDDFRRRNIDYDSYLNAADFEEYSRKGAEIQNPTFEEAQGGANIFGWRPGASDVGNIVTFSRDNLDKIEERMASDDRSQFVGNALYGHMTEKQVKIYNYILAKEGKEAAQIYLDSIAETLNEEYGKQVAATVESTRGTALHPIMVAGTATSAGLDQYIGGVKQAFNEYEQPTSGIQYAGQAVREDQGAIGKFAYDVISTLSNMAPSILANYVAVGMGVPAKAAEWVAAGSIGLGSGGNAYKQALAEGRSRDEAKNVAVLTGASEAVLSKLLSGISAVGGLTPKKLLPKVAAIENGIWRVAAAAGVKLGGEVSEEVLQLYMEPLFKTLIYGDKYDAPTVEEVAYTALLTMVTTGLLEGGEIAKYRTKEGAAEAVRAELQEDAQSEPAGVSETPNAPGQDKTENAPAASQTEQKKASTGLRDPMLVIMEENRKAKAQQNEKTAAETQRNVSESNTGNVSQLDTEAIREALAADLESGEITEDQYDAALAAIMEQESQSDTNTLDTYNRERLEKLEVNPDGRSSISDERSERAAGQSAGEQAGEMAEGTGRDQSGQVQSQRAASRRDDVARYYESQGQSAVSAREFLGTDKVNKVSTVQEMPETMVAKDSELAGIAQEASSMGLTARFFVGEAYLQNGNTVDGMIRDNVVYIRADSDTWTAAQNWEHEKAHAILRKSPGIEAQLYGKIVGKGEAARRKLHQTIQRYREAYHGIYDVDENGNEIWDDTVQEKIMQEILTDAYAGKDTFGQDVQEYGDVARDAASQIEERGGEVRGPPEDAFSIESFSDGRKYVKADRQVLFGNNVEEWSNQLEDYINGKIRRGENVQLIADDGELLTLTGDTAGKVSSIYKEGARLSDEYIERKFSAGAHIDELATVSVGGRPARADKNNAHGTKASSGWNYRTAFFRDFDGSYYKCTISVMKGPGGNVVYNIGKMEKRSFPAVQNALNGSSTDGGARREETSLPTTLSQSKPSVKGDESFSAGETEQEAGSEDPIAAMPAKARRGMESAEGKLQRSLAKVFGMPEKVPKGVLSEVSREISKEFLETGTVSDETIDRTFETVYRTVESEIKKQRGADAEDYRRWAERDYIAEVAKHLAEMRLVRRYAAERSEAKAKGEPEKVLTLEKLPQAYADLKSARRLVDKAVARNLLTEADEAAVNSLLRGDGGLDQLKPDKYNVRGITEVYNAKMEYEKVARKIRRWNATRKGELRAVADKLLETASDWKDKKSGWMYSRETMERNIRDIVPDEKIAQEIIDTLFTPIHVSNAAATKMKNEYRDRVHKMKLGREVAKGNKISEAAAVQLLGEAEDNIKYLQDSRYVTVRDGKTLEEWQGVVADLWKQNPKLDAGKIREAVGEFRQIYDELFEQLNTVRMRNGYEPINYRQGYFPHFQNEGGDGILAQFGKSLGINTAALQLPTTINGLTHTFKPGIQWFGSAQQRLGTETTFDAVEGFDSYIEGVADVINQTDNIQRLRAFATQVRARTADEALKKRISETENNPTLTEEEKRTLIEKIWEDGRYELGNFAVELDEYTNLLAGKKSRHDRDMEQKMGRKWYAIMKGLEGRVAANMVAVNPGSWLTNFIPLTQGVATLDTGSLLSGMWDTLKAIKRDDGIVAASSFLTNRRGSDPLVRTWAQKASAVLSSPMELIDSLTAGSLVRARYNENIRRGLSEEAAMADADAWAAGVMADRSKGATPTLFSQTNPLTKLFTQFQLEVNNQLSYVFKDIPREMKEKGIMALAMALFKFALGAYLYNELYEELVGRRPALDPIGMLKETVHDVRTEGVYDAGLNLAVGVVEELPFVGSLLGGGRLPISSAIPDVGKLWQAISDSDWDSKKRVSTAAKELAKPATYLALPFGGGQVKKIVEGIEAIAREGSYSVDSSGADILQYPVYASTPGEAGKAAVRALFFGKSALPTAREWVESGFDSLGARQTEVYKTLIDANINSQTAYDTIREWERIGSDKEMASYARGLMQRGLITGLDLSDRQKLQVYATLSGSSAETRVEKFSRLMDHGLTWREIMLAFNKQQELNNDESIAKAGDKAAKFAEYVLGEMTVDKALAAIEEMKFYVTMSSAPSQGSLKDALNRTGLSTSEKRTVWYDYCELYGWKAASPW